MYPGYTYLIAPQKVDCIAVNNPHPLSDGFLMSLGFLMVLTLEFYNSIISIVNSSPLLSIDIYENLKS